MGGKQLLSVQHIDIDQGAALGKVTEDKALDDLAPAVIDRYGGVKLDLKRSGISIAALHRGDTNGLRRGGAIGAEMRIRVCTVRDRLMRRRPFGVAPILEPYSTARAQLNHPGRSCLPAGIFCARMWLTQLSVRRFAHTSETVLP